MKQNLILSLLFSFTSLFLTHCMEHTPNEKKTSRPIEEKKHPDQRDKKRRKLNSEEEQIELAIHEIEEQTEKKSLGLQEEQKQRTFTISAGEWHEQGFRKEMEDTSINKPDEGIFAIFDGHGGDCVAKYAADNLVDELKKIKGSSETILNEALANLNEKIRINVNSDNTGSCAVIALIDNDGKICIANIGDSRAVLARNGEAIALTEDHNCENLEEKNRIESFTKEPQAGKYLSNKYGHLGVTRALGDFCWHDHGLIGTPDIKYININTDDEYFLILACDGIFERIDRQEAVNIVKQSFENHKGDENIETIAAKELVLTALTGFKDPEIRNQAFNILSKVFAESTAFPGIRPMLSQEIPSQIQNGEIKGQQDYQCSQDNLSVIIVTFKPIKD